MLYKNLLVRELYASIPATSIIAWLFKTGLEIGSTQLAVSAMEELIVREDYDIIAAELQSAAKAEKLKYGTSMVSMIGRSLMESCRNDPLLHKYGKALLRGQGEEGPFNWVQSDEAAMYFKNDEAYAKLVDKYRAATAAYLEKNSEKIRETLGIAGLAPMERTVVENNASITQMGRTATGSNTPTEWLNEVIDEAIAEAFQPQG